MYSKQQNWLGNLVKKNRVGHAYCFYGVSEDDMRNVALKFCNEIFKLNSLGHPDFYFLDKNKNETISIHEVRDLIHFLSLTPFVASRKIAIISGVSRLTFEAATALLKSIEEPPGQSVLLLLAQNIDEVLPTIRSRCVLVRFNPVAESDIVEILTKKGIDREKALTIAALSNGYYANAEKLLEKSEQSFVKKALAALMDFMYADISQSFDQAKDLADDERLSDIVTLWLITVRSLMFQQLEIKTIPILKKKIAISLEELSKILSKLFYIHDLLSSQFGKGINKRLLLENFILVCKGIQANKPISQ